MVCPRGGALVLLGGFCWSVPNVYQKTGFYNKRGNEMSKTNVAEVFPPLRLPLLFSAQLQSLFRGKPDGYSSADMKALAASDDAVCKTPAVRPNVIFVMCEAYTDLSDEDVFLYTEEENPTHGFHVLAESGGQVRATSLSAILAAARPIRSSMSSPASRPIWSPPATRPRSASSAKRSNAPAAGLQARRLQDLFHAPRLQLVL